MCLNLQNTNTTKNNPSLDVLETKKSDSIQKDKNSEKSALENENLKEEEEIIEKKENKKPLFIVKKFQGRKRRRILQKNLDEYKTTLKITNDQRKTHLDSLMKKVKSRFHKAIFTSLRKCLNIQLKRLPQKYITNIKIEENKAELNKTVFQIFNENNILSSMSDLSENGRIRQGKQESVLYLMGITLREAFIQFLSSKIYKDILSKIRKKEGETQGNLFDFMAKNFLFYFSNGKGYKPKKVKIKKFKVIKMKPKASENKEMGTK